MNIFVSFCQLDVNLRSVSSVLWLPLLLPNGNDTSSENNSLQDFTLIFVNIDCRAALLYMHEVEICVFNRTDFYIISSMKPYIIVIK